MGSDVSSEVKLKTLYGVFFFLINVKAARVLLSADGIDAIESVTGHDNNDKCLSDQYLSKAISVFSGDLLYGMLYGKHF